MTTAQTTEDDQEFALSLQLKILDEDTHMGGTSSHFSPRSSSRQSDWDIAREMFKADLRAQQRVETDRRLAASIRRAVVQDAEIIAFEVGKNQQFERDLDLARRLGQGTAEIPVNEPLVQANIKRPKLSHFTHTRSTEIGPSHSAAKPSGPDDRVICDVCMELLNDYENVALPCEHNYCRKCLYQTFKQAMDDPDTSFPPRCCETIPTTLAAEVLSDAELEKYFYESILHESGGRRHHCSRHGCNQALFPGWIKHDLGLCMKCNHWTCMICRGTAHDGDCPKDKDTIELLKLAASRRWQGCPNCSRVVELVQGCYHMTCRCKFQFCYTCGAKWKTCKCTQADEAYITGRPANLTPGVTPSGSAISFPRSIPPARRAELEAEHRQQAVQYNEILQRRLEALMTLRRTRESQRDAVMVDRMVKAEEERVRQELKEEERKKESERRRKWARRRVLEKIFRKKLERVNDTIAARGKGKGSQEGPGGNEALVWRLAEATMYAESMPTVSTARTIPRVKTSSNSVDAVNGSLRNGGLSPITQDRMAGVHGMLRVRGL